MLTATHGDRRISFPESEPIIRFKLKLKKERLCPREGKILRRPMVQFDVGLLKMMEKFGCQIGCSNRNLHLYYFII
jgi:hypothetical protein